MTDKKYWLLTEFQSTLPQRERPCLRFFQPGQLQFQSTLPQRERRKESNIHQSNSYFNPRSRKGSDSRTGGHVRQILNFNPRSRKGSDSFRLSQRFFHIYFNPRSRKGSDDSVNACVGYFSPISIHAPAKGATISCLHTSTVF